MARKKSLPPLPEHDDGLGNRRPLGFLPGDPARMMAIPPPAASELIPESEWVEFDEWPEPVKIKDQDGKGACFPAGTRIRMLDGSERNIEDVRLLDLVLTAEGRRGRVVRTMVRDADDGLIRLMLWGHTHLTATAEHPVLTKRGYMPLGKLRLDDWVAMPRYHAVAERHVHVADHVSARVMMTRAGTGRRHFNAPEGRTQVDVALSRIPDAIELTPGVGSIFGLFFAEGRTDATKVTWTFNRDEETTLVADLVALLRSEWDVEAHVQHRPNNSINVVVYGKAWACLFESLCGNGSGGKRLHPDLTLSSLQFATSLLSGWLEGDGHGRRTERQGVTVSRDLALGMFDIAQALGLRPAIRRYQSKTYGTVRTRRPRWEVTMGEGGGDTYRCQMDDSHVWRKVKGIEREEFTGPVYNLEVEGDNSYVAEGVGVHNCNGHAAALGAEVIRWNSGAPHVPLSAWYVYSILCGGIDRGSAILDALQLLEDKGDAPETEVQYGLINPNRLTAAAHAAAAHYKMEIGNRISTPAEIGSAIQRRQVINLAVCVGGGFNNLNSDGVPGLGRGFCNHAVFVGMGMKRDKNGKWLGKMANSWTTQWGLNGFCWLPIDYVPTAMAFEAYTLRAPFDDSADNTNPPVLIA